MQDALDMSWAEFILRSIAFREKRKFEMSMVREIAYQSYCAQFIFSKKKPKSKKKFWPLEDKKNKGGVSETQRQAFLKAYLNYKKQVNG